MLWPLSIHASAEGDGCIPNALGAEIVSPCTQKDFHLLDHQPEEFSSRHPAFQAWMGLTPDGSPLLMRDTGTQEVYTLDFEEP